MLQPSTRSDPSDVLLVNFLIFHQKTVLYSFVLQSLSLPPPLTPHCYQMTLFSTRWLGVYWSHADRVKIEWRCSTQKCVSNCSALWSEAGQNRATTLSVNKHFSCTLYSIVIFYGILMAVLNILTVLFQRLGMCTSWNQWMNIT